MARYYQPTGGIGLGYASSYDPAETQQMTDLLQREQGRYMGAVGVIAGREGELSSIPTQDLMGRQRVIEDFQTGIKQITDKFGGDLALAAPELARYTAKQRANPWFEFNRQQLEEADRYQKNRDRLGTGFHATGNPSDVSFEDFQQNPRALQFDVNDLRPLDEITRTQGKTLSQYERSKGLVGLDGDAEGYLQRYITSGFKDQAAAEAFMNTAHTQNLISELIVSQGLDPEDINIRNRTSTNLKASLTGNRKDQFLRDLTYNPTKNNSNNSYNQPAEDGFVNVGKDTKDTSAYKSVTDISNRKKELKSDPAFESSESMQYEHDYLVQREKNADKKLEQSDPAYANIKKELKGWEFNVRRLDAISESAELTDADFIKNASDETKQKIVDNLNEYIRDAATDRTDQRGEYLEFEVDKIINAAGLIDPELIDPESRMTPGTQGMLSNKSTEPEDYRKFKNAAADIVKYYRGKFADPNLGRYNRKALDKQIASDQSTTVNYRTPKISQQKTFNDAFLGKNPNTFIVLGESDKLSDKIEPIKPGEFSLVDDFSTRIIEMGKLNEGGKGVAPSVQAKVENDDGDTKWVELGFNQQDHDDFLRDLAAETNSPGFYHNNRNFHLKFTPGLPNQASNILNDPNAQGAIEEIPVGRGQKYMYKLTTPLAETFEFTTDKLGDAIDYLRMLNGKGSLNQQLTIDQLVKSTTKVQEQKYLRQKLEEYYAD